MPKRYKKSPVAQATTTFFFDPTAAQDPTVPGLLFGFVRNSYPTRRLVDKTLITIPTTSTKPGQLMTAQGTQFSSESGKDFIQVGPRVLTVGRLSPYEDWESFLPKIEQAFAAYRSAVEPKEIEYVSVSYSNKIDIPKLPFHLEEYFEFYPYLGKGLPQELGPFMMGVQLPFDSENDFLRIQLQTAVSTQPNTAVLLLTIEYSTVRKLPIAWDPVKSWLDIANGRAADAFEGSITNLLRKLFEPVEVV